jgi:hypothetical protein
MLIPQYYLGMTIASLIVKSGSLRNTDSLTIFVGLSVIVWTVWRKLSTDLTNHGNILSAVVIDHPKVDRKQHQCNRQTVGCCYHIG